MKTNYFFLYFFFIILTGCSDDKITPELPPNTNDTYEGVHDQIKFSNETEDFTYGELAFYIKVPDGSIIERKAKHQRISGISHFIMEKGLKEGKYQLLYMEYTVKSDCPEIDGLKRQFGLCCQINITPDGIRIESTYNSNMKLYGAGTPDDPYLIGSNDDLNKIRTGISNRYVSSSTCYSQQNNIDMTGYNDKCGWEGNWYQIGQSATYPFTGYYYGNGYSIKNMTLKDPNKIAASLFGYVNKAVIMDLTIQNADITGYCAVSAIAGAIVTSGSGQDPTFIKGCTVKSSTIQSQGDGMGIGGIVGSVDPITKLWIDSCKVDDNTVQGAIAVGGILGGANVLSTTQITNSSNEKGKVEAYYMNAGGIVGYADSLYVYLCTNKSQVKGGTHSHKPDRLSGFMGTGGIVGGSGISSIITCRNEGSVNGQRGVGGIIGSTLVILNPATYNNTFIGCCSNKGRVNGKENVGGLCGEAQLGTYKSYNEGKVTADGYYAGGIIGATPLSSITNTINFGTVSASRFSGGMTGQIQSGSLALNVNMGKISGSTYIGGMAGIAGGCLSMNYCANLADVEGNGYIAGLIGEVGDSREWTEAEKRSAIFATIELGLSVFNTVVGIADAGTTILNNLITSHDAVMESISAYSLGKEMADLFRPMQRKDYTTSLSGLVTKGMEKLETDMDNILRNKLSALQFSTPNLQYGRMIDQFMNEYRKKVIAWYETGKNHEDFRDAMNYKRNLRYNQILDIKKTEKIIHTLADGVCFIASTAAFVAGFVATGGVSTIIAAAGVVVSVVGYANSITAIADDFQENAVVISQCVSFGNIRAKTGPYGDYNGGLIGHFDEGCLISDCLNGSDGNKIGGATVGSPEKQAVVKKCLNIGSQWKNFAYTGNALSRFEDNYCLENTIENRNIHGATGLTLPQLSTTSTFQGWDFQRLWKIPYTGLGYFPVPYQSEMQYKEPQL